MKFKNLLSLGAMLSCGLVAQAQVPVFHESFEAAQTKQPTEVGYYEEINKEEGDDWSIAPGGAEGNCFNFFNSIDVLNPDESWRRAVKFRNLPLEAGKSYRLSFRFKGSNVYSNGETDVKARMKVGLMQGVENADISVLGAGDKDQYRFVSYFNPDKYETYNLMYYFADKANQDAKYDKSCSGKEEYNEANKDKYFATFNVFNPGDYCLDEVELVEANIAGIIYNGDVIRVDLGYATNAKTLAGTKGYYLLPNDCVTVTVGGSEVVVESVEARSDGYLYIFLEKAAGKGEVEVQFRNPAEGGLQYAEGEAITGNVLDFTEKAELKDTFNKDGEISSWLYGEAQCVATTPLDGSFGLEGISEVTFTFDKEVYSGKNDINDGPVAKLSDGTVLKLKEGTPELTKTLTFVNENGAFAKGSYIVTLENIVTEKAIENQNPTMLTFEVGKPKVAETIYTPAGSCTFSDAADGTVPEGWTVYSDGEERTSGNSYGSGGRVMSTKAPQGKGIYTRANGSNLEEGALNGAVISPAMEIPAGDVEIRSLLAYWSNPSSIQVDVLNSADEVVATSQFTPAVAGEANRNVDGFNFENCPIRFTSEGGQYHVKYTLLTTGYNGMFVGGYDLFSVQETEGDKDQSEVIAKGDFSSAGNDKAPAHGTGWKVYRGDGRMRDPGANCGWGSGEWSGDGGPRVKTLGNKGMNGAAIYLGNNDYATYGEYLLQTDHGGALEGNLEEKTLDLKNAKYQMTYNIIAWKATASPCSIQLDIYNQEDGITGTPVYTRKDEVSVHCNGATDTSSDAKKIQFLWNAPKAGKYILKFTAGGECCVGNVSVETTSSLAVTYATLMNKNLAPAKEELETAKGNDKYAGSTRDALESMVAAYTNPDFHTVAEYTDAFEKLDAMVKKSAKRRANIDKFPTCLESIVKGLEDAKDPKYKGLEQFPLVEKAYNDYKDVDCVTLDDDALQVAIDVMGVNGSLISNMVKSCVPLITKQITDLAAAIVALDEDMSGHPAVLASGNAITDDQALVKQLKTLYAAKLYKKIAGGYEFKVWDQDMADEVEETIDASFLIQNPNFYNTTIIPAGKENAEAQTTDFPGWNITVESSRIQSLWSTNWGEKGATETQPYYDCAVCSPWGTGKYNVEQLVNNIPVAKYNASIVVASDKVNDDELPYHIAFVDSEEKQEKQWMGTTDENGNTTWKRDSKDPVVFENITPAIEGNYASLTIGAKLTNACFGKVDNATLTMVGKAEGFDYAAAAKALGEEVAAGIKNAEVAPEGDPVSVVFYDLNGRQISAPNGVAIKVEKWANGYTKISKVVEK